MTSYRHRVFALCLVLGVSLPGPGWPISLQNGEFESTDYHGNWEAVGGSIAPSNDAYTGSHSAHVYNRQQSWNAISQNVNMQGGQAYKIIVYVKLLSNVHNLIYQEVKIMVGCKDKHGQDFYQSFGRSPRVQHGLWYAIGGVRRLPSGSHGCRFYVETDAPTEYLVDHASIQEVTLPSDWKTAANQRIDKLRKADVSIKLAGTGIDNTALTVELVQEKSEFAFGSAVRADMITDPNQHAYQQVFYDTFEWAVFVNALKWYSTEKYQGQFHYDEPLQAIQELRNHGVKVRGHNVFWGVDQYVQDWIKGLSQSALTQEMQARVQRVVGKTKGMLEHWDVNNEDLHGDWYERHTGDPNITMDMFRQVHAVDSKPKLFLNEYNVISKNDVAVALMDKARRYKQAGVPIGGIGVEGHLHDVDLPIIWERLNILGEADLPIFITEVGINEKNEVTKATKLENLLTMFFSHPKVEGVLFWGFWDAHIWEKDAALFTGSSCTPNAAGRKLQDLLKHQWRTHATHTLNGSETWSTRAFKGTYKVNVKHNGHVIKTETFDLTSADQSLEIHLDGQQNGHPHVSQVIVG